MTRRRCTLILPMLAVAALLAGAAQLEAAQRSGEPNRQVIELIVTADGQQTRLASVEGVPARITTASGEVLELVATVEPRGADADPRVAIAAYRMVPIGPSSTTEQSSLLSTHLLERGDSAIVFGGRAPIEAELVTVRDAAPNSGLRPTNRCCISCPGGPSVCACEVNTPCGSCSAGC